MNQYRDAAERMVWDEYVDARDCLLYFGSRNTRNAEDYDEAVEQVEIWTILFRALKENQT